MGASRFHSCRRVWSCASARTKSCVHPHPLQVGTSSWWMRRMAARCLLLHASGGEPELQLLPGQLRRAMVLPFLRRLGAAFGVLRACSMLSIAWQVVARRVRSQKRIAQATWIVRHESLIFGDLPCFGRVSPEQFAVYSCRVW